MSKTAIRPSAQPKPDHHQEDRSSERIQTCHNNLLGTFELSGIAPARRGEPKIEVTFSLDTDGILSVKAEDKLSGRVSDIRITNKDRLSESGVKRMIADSEANKVEDEKVRLRYKARNQLEALAFSTKAQLTEEPLTSKLPTDERDKVYKACEGVIRWLESNQLAEVEEIEYKQKELTELVQSVLSSVGADGGAADFEAAAGASSAGFGTGSKASKGSASSQGPIISEVD